MTDIKFSVEDHVAHVVLNRGDRMNAITPQMDELLEEAWSEINNNSEIWAAILSASGERAFCVGADVSGSGSSDRRVALGGGLTGIGGPMLTLRKPLIAAVHGYVLGGGLELAMCSDIMVASSSAQFGLPETRVGIIGECGVMHRLIRQCSYRVAMGMILTGERIDAQKALESGLVNEVVSPENLLSAANEWAEKIIRSSPLAVQAAKQAVQSRLGYPLEVALATRYEAIEAYAFSEDIKEGSAAFSEKRKPSWQGR